MNDTLNDPEIVFAASLDRAYRRTREQFERWANEPAYSRYVRPPATGGNVGFAIFYTPPRFRPNLVIVGQNPSNFAGEGAPLTAVPNPEMLAGKPPTVNSYNDHEHLFGRTLRDALMSRPDLENGYVGMNVWHFQCVDQATSAPRALQLFCEETSRDLVDATKPTNVLCFGKAAFNALARSGQRVEGTRKAEFTTRSERTYWYVPHITGSWTRDDARNDLPIVLSLMT